MTETHIGLYMIVTLILVGTFRNYIMPAIQKWDIPLLDYFVRGLNGDTYADGKEDWE